MFKLLNVRVKFWVFEPFNHGGFLWFIDIFHTKIFVKPSNVEKKIELRGKNTKMLLIFDLIFKIFLPKLLNK